jgi:hypothetical protein
MLQVGLHKAEMPRIRKVVMYFRYTLQIDARKILLNVPKIDSETRLIGGFWIIHLVDHNDLGILGGKPAISCARVLKDTAI